ncbi:MAG: hypothetical protein SGPRY_009122, partial [Prymnesium sp.]
EGIALAAASPEEAVARLEASLSLRPSHAPTRVNLGLIHEQIGLPLAAIQCYATALANDPTSAAAYERMGEVMASALGEATMGEEALRLAVSLDPSRASAWNSLGSLLHTRGELEEAADSLGRARELSPADRGVVRNLGTALRAQARWQGGRFNESLRLLQEANGEENELAFAPGQLEGGGGVCSKEKAERAEVTGTGEQGRVGLRLDKSSLPPRAPARWRTVLSEVRLTRVASEEDCEWVISTAEKHALETGAPGLPSSSRLAQLPPSSPWSLSFPSLPGRHCGWDVRGHHVAYPTKDIQPAQSELLRSWLRKKLKHTIWPAVDTLIPWDASQPGLGMHVDDSEISFNLLLSDPQDFEGGGTAFEAAGNATI